jgi:SAM-dependent methyltransferase
MGRPGPGSEAWRASVRSAVRRKYAQVAVSPEGRFRYPTGRAGAEALGYGEEWLRDAPREAVEGFCGVGDPLALGPVREGEAVLDVGCGAGLDLWRAARLVGPRGRACGVEPSPEMAARARRALGGAGVEVLEGAAEAIPCPDAAFDVVLSNGALNLSPDKEGALAELRRVLRPGGRLQVADMVLREELPAGERDARAWSE